MSLSLKIKLPGVNVLWKYRIYINIHAHRLLAVYLGMIWICSQGLYVLTRNQQKTWYSVKQVDYWLILPFLLRYDDMIKATNKWGCCLISDSNWTEGVNLIESTDLMY